MGAMSPLFLAAAVAVGVPIFLHLFHRHEAQRISFPALRYLARTEREHARRIRSRQLLLLLVRMAIILILVGAGAGLFLRGRGGDHPPTALAIVLDNSMSSGFVEGEERTLDRLKGLALRTLDLSNEGDRIWVIEAGRPWLTALPGGPSEARRRVEEVDVSAARGDLSAAVARATELLRTSGMEHMEVHVLSDLQATAFSEAVAPGGDVPVVVPWSDEPRTNRGLTGVVVGGGLPPLEGQRSEVTTYSASSDPADTLPVAVRVVIDERVRGAGGLRPGAALSLSLPGAPSGWVRGYVDQDADALRADDRRHFVYRARPPPGVAIGGDPGLFVHEALSVLEAAGRLTLSGSAGAHLLISQEAEGLDAARPETAALIVPAADPTRLPGLNRRLGQEGVPWRVEPRVGQGEAPLAGDELPEPLRSVRVREAYRLSLAGPPPAPTGSLADAGGRPWLVEGTDARGRRYLLLASALDDASTSLPVSAGMVSFVDWVASQWAEAGGTAPDRTAGLPLSAPRPADRVALPSGDTLPVDGTRMVRDTDQAGLYTFLSGDSVVSIEAVNPDPAESDLTPVDAGSLDERLGRDVTIVRRDGAWERSVFRDRQGPRLTRALLLVALLLLLLESALAAAGRRPVSTGPVAATAARGPS
jgi:hypothetical protein